MIIYLDTGTGKTVISIMLMNYYLKKNPYKKVKIFFGLIKDFIPYDHNLAGGAVVLRNYRKDALDLAKLIIHYGRPSGQLVIEKNSFDEVPRHGERRWLQARLICLFINSSI